MSMHNTPLTDLEREGLEKHLLAIEYPSQLADVFRQGIAWALSKSQSTSQDVLNAERWRHFACAQTAMMLGSELEPMDTNVNWLEECNRLADAAMKVSKQ